MNWRKIGGKILHGFAIVVAFGLCGVAFYFSVIWMHMGFAHEARHHCEHLEYFSPQQMDSVNREYEFYFGVPCPRPE